MKRFLELKGSILASQNRLAEALTVFQEALAMAPQERKAMLNVGACLSLLGHYDQAGWFFGRCSRLYPDDPLARLWLVENLLMDDRGAQAAERLGGWIDSHGLAPLEQAITQYIVSPLSFPVSFPLTKALMVEKLAARVALWGEDSMR